MLECSSIAKLEIPCLFLMSRDPTTTSCCFYSMHHPFCDFHRQHVHA